MTIESLHKLFLQHPGVSTDTRSILPNSIFFALKGANFNGNSFALSALEKGAAYAVVDEVANGPKDRILRVPEVLETLQQLASFHRQQTAVRIIGITGSNGKTTTKELIHAVLSEKYRTIATKGNLNNHIGVPLTLLSIQEDTEMAVVEMGANHPGEIAFLSGLAQPDFGYISNFGKAHLEGFGSIEGVIKAKTELYRDLIARDKAVFLNADDAIQREQLQGYAKKIGFSEDNPQYFNIKFLGAQPNVSLELEGSEINTQLVGHYNFSNCGAAALIGKYFNIPVAAIKHALENYKPKNNRSQRLSKNGHQILLDAYNANPTSMRAALENFDRMEGTNKVVFLGDMFELGTTAADEHQEIATLAKGMKFQKVFLIGEHFIKAATGASGFTGMDALAGYLKLHPLKESNILIKGSRGMAMERILELL